MTLMKTRKRPLSNRNWRERRTQADLMVITVGHNIDRQCDESRLRPEPLGLDDVLAKFSMFSPDFMAEGRGSSEQAARDKQSEPD